MVLFTLIILISQNVFLAGLVLKSYSIALIGVGMLSFVGECQNIAQSIIVTDWFKDKELSTAFSLSFSISLLGRVFSSYIQPKIASLGSIEFSYMTVILICAFSLIFSLASLVLNKLLRVKEKIYLKTEFKLENLKKFTVSFWIICMNLMLVYIGIYCFINIASKFYQEKFGYDAIEAGNILSILFIINIILFPILGIVLDTIGRRVEFIILSSVILTFVHVGFIFTPDSSSPFYPIFYMGLLAVGYSVYASAVWPCINYLVPSELIGTGFGLAYCILNIGLCIGPTVIGYIKENTIQDKGYFWISVFFVFTEILGTLVSIIIYINDMKTGKILKSFNPLILKENPAGQRSTDEISLFSYKNMDNK